MVDGALSRLFSILGYVGGGGRLLTASGILRQPGNGG